MLKIYYNPEPTWTTKMMNTMVIVLQDFVAKLYMERPKMMARSRSMTKALIVAHISYITNLLYINFVAPVTTN